MSSGAHQYLSNVQKASKTARNHGLKSTRRYAHRYRRFGNLRIMLNKWRPIIADAVDHVLKALLLKSVYTRCANDVNSIFESPDVENLPIMKINLNNEKFMR